MRFVVDGPAKRIVKPAPYYAEVAAACRAMGLNIKNNDYEKIDDLMKMVLPFEAHSKTPLLN